MAPICGEAAKGLASACKVGVIDVGGGLRGSYASGVFDRCLDEGIRFDVGVGVSAGSANLASFAAGQRGRNLRFYAQYAQRGEYMGFGNFLRNRSYVNLDYVYSTLSDSDGEDPLDFAAVLRNSMELVVVATDAGAGHGKYFTKDDAGPDRYDILKASSAIPGACRPYVIDGVPYFDGALADPVPVEKALEMGCDKVVVVLTLPRDTVRKPGKDLWGVRAIRREFPRAAAMLATRADRYNAGVHVSERLAAEGRALIVAPDDTCGVTTLSRDARAIARLYRKGYEDAAVIAPFLRR